MKSDLLRSQIQTRSDIRNLHRHKSRTCVCLLYHDKFILVQMSIVCLGARDSEAAQMSLHYVTGLNTSKFCSTSAEYPPPPPQFALVSHGSASRCRTHQKHSAGKKQTGKHRCRIFFYSFCKFVDFYTADLQHRGLHSRERLAALTV